MYTPILHSLSLQLDILRLKNKQEEDEKDLAILCSECTKKHPCHACPLENVEVCNIRGLEHDTKKCPSLPGLRFFYQGEK